MKNLILVIALFVGILAPQLAQAGGGLQIVVVRTAPVTYASPYSHGLRFENGRPVRYVISGGLGVQSSCSTQHRARGTYNSSSVVTGSQISGLKQPVVQQKATVRPSKPAPQVGKASVGGAVISGLKFR